MSGCESIQEIIRSKRTELDRLIERDDTLQRRVAHEGHKVATDRQQDEGDIDVQDKRGRTSDDKRGTKEGASYRTSSVSACKRAETHTSAHRWCIWLFRGRECGSCQSSAMRFDMTQDDESERSRLNSYCARRLVSVLAKLVGGGRLHTLRIPMPKTTSCNKTQMAAKRGIKPALDEVSTRRGARAVDGRRNRF